MSPSADPAGPFEPSPPAQGATIAGAVASGPALVHFFDFAQLNAVRTLPYVNAWAERYREPGLTVLGVHSPRHPFTAERRSLATALPRLGIRHPVADDSGLDVWHDYGCRGWPSLFLWARGGALHWYHFGEGEYRGTEEAIQELLRSDHALLELPEPLDPMRASDAPGALVAPPSAEVLPGGSHSQPWEPGPEAPAIELDYAAGEAHAAVDGEGELRVVVDGSGSRAVRVERPGLVALAEHPRHEEHSLRIEADPGVRIWAVSFAAGVP